MSIMSKVTRFARSPQGRRLAEKAARYARSREGRRRVEGARAKLGKRK